MSKLRFATATCFAAVMAASCTAWPAAADPLLCYPDQANYNSGLCEQWRAADTAGRIRMQQTPAFAEPGSPVYEEAHQPSWFSEHSGLIALIVFAVIAFVVVKVLRASAADDAKKASEEQQAAVERGRAIAHGAGTELAAQSPADLQRYAAFQWAVPHVPGTAFGNLVTRDGGTSRVHAAWTEAAELARLGHWDEDGGFTPAATVINVNGYADDTGDLELSVDTRDYTVGEKELNRVLEHLTRTARVETASPFTRDAVRDWHVTRLSMTPAEVQQQQAAAPEQPAAPDPAAGWEW